MVILGLLVSLWGFSQSLSPSVIATQGKVSEGSTVTLSWTLGELAVQTFQSPTGLLTEGFHQPMLIVSDLNLADNNSELEFMIAPNPVESKLYMSLISGKEQPVIVVVQNALGQLLKRIEGRLSTDDQEIDMTMYPSGYYFLSVRKNDGTLLKTFKISKL